MTGLVEVKVAEATGAVLDWMVAKAAGELYADVQTSPGCTSKAVVIDLHFEHAVISLRPCPTGWCFYRPSTDWSQCGPLIERGLISTIYEPVDEPGAPGFWRAFFRHDDPEFVHSSKLVAGLRALVHSSLGAVVSVPAELVEVRHAE